MLGIKTGGKMEDDIYADVKKAYSKASVWSWASTFAAGASIAIGAGLVFSVFFSEQIPLSRAELTNKVITIESRLEEQEVILAKVQTSIESISSTLNTLSALPENKEWSLEAKKLENNIELVSNKLINLESALTADPAKALAVPILRKDLDNAEKSIRAELSQTKSNIDRIYDQNKWFIGLVFTIALSVFGMAIGSFFKK